MIALTVAFLSGAFLRPHLVRVWPALAYRVLWFRRHWPRRCYVCGKRSATNIDFDRGPYHPRCEQGVA